VKGIQITSHRSSSQTGAESVKSVRVAAGYILSWKSVRSSQTCEFLVSTLSSPSLTRLITFRDTEPWLSARRSAQTSNAGPSQQPMLAQPDQYTDTGLPEGPGEAPSIAPSCPLLTTGSAIEQGTNGESDPSQNRLPSFQDFMTGTFGPDPTR
jgi:hypothetical protein